jgi:hypothetical protein
MVVARTEPGVEQTGRKDSLAAQERVLDHLRPGTGSSGRGSARKPVSQRLAERGGELCVRDRVRRDEVDDLSISVRRRVRM